MKLRKSLATLLTVTLLSTPFARAGESEQLKKLNLTPAAHNGVIYVDKKEQKDLAAYVKVCEVSKKDLKDTTASYNTCLGKLKDGTQWWQTPAGVASVGVVGLFLGIMATGLSK